MNDGNDAPDYLGRTAQKTTTATVVIQVNDSGSTQSRIAKVGDYISYVGATVDTIWTNGSCLQYTDNGWVKLDPLDSRYTDFYMRALRDIVAGAPTGVFSVLMAQKIMAMEATITQLMATLLKINNAIFGGPRFTINAQGNLVDNGSSLAGFKLGADGKLIVSDGVFDRGTFIDIVMSGGALSNIVADGGLSGRITNRKHLYIHTSHRIVSPRTIGQLYTALRELNVNPGEVDYNYILCSGYVRISQSSGFLDLFPWVIRTNESNLIFLTGNGLVNNVMSRLIEYTLNIGNTTPIQDMELFVF